MKKPKAPPHAPSEPAFDPPMSESHHDSTAYAPSAAQLLQPAVPVSAPAHRPSVQPAPPPHNAFGRAASQSAAQTSGGHAPDAGSSGAHPAIRRTPTTTQTFAQVFEHYAPYVLRVLPRLGVAAADAEDVAQDVFLTVFRKLPDFEGRSSLRTWIYGICIRTASNYRQRAHRRYEATTDRPPEITMAARQPTDLQQRRDLDLLDVALQRIAAPKREVFVLYEIEELSMHDVARAVGCPLFTAYARLYAARREIRATFTRARRREP